MLTSQQFVNNEIKVSYTEMHQNNHLRWQVLFREENGLFFNQTKEFMCKDFFNDLTAAYHGKHFAVYGMDNAKVKLNDYGMWLRLHNVTPQFFENVENAINSKLFKEMGIVLEPVPVDDRPGEVLVLLPRVLFNHTYTISGLTALIRACNDTTLFISYEDLVAKTQESLLLGYPHIWEAFEFLPPKHLRKFWWWQGDKYNSEENVTGYHLSSSVHNNGVFAWTGTVGFNKV